MDGEAWQATVQGVAKSRTRLSDFTHTLTHTHTHSHTHTHTHTICFIVAYEVRASH